MILLLILLSAVNSGSWCPVTPAPVTNSRMPAARHQEGPHTREQASPEGPGVHPEQEPHRAEQQNNMI